MFFIIQEFSFEVSLCFPLAKNPLIYYYLIKVLLVILMKHQEGLENEKYIWSQRPGRTWAIWNILIPFRSVNICVNFPQWEPNYLEITSSKSNRNINNGGRIIWPNWIVQGNCMDYPFKWRNKYFTFKTNPNPYRQSTAKFHVRSKHINTKYHFIKDYAMRTKEYSQSNQHIESSNSY